MNNCVFVRVDNRKYVTRAEKAKLCIYKCFNKVRIEKHKRGIIILIPLNYLKDKKKIRKQIEKIFLKEKNSHIIYANGIEEDLNCSKILRNYTGKILMKKLVFQIIESIYNIVNERVELDDIYVFMNEYNIENLRIIDELVNMFKTVNIITSSIFKFKVLEKKYEREGILITVSNNKRKSAIKAGIILNVDFDNKSFNKYCINSNAIVINLNKEKITENSYFNGVIVNDYNIEINEDEKVYVEEFYGKIDFKMWVEFMMEEMKENAVDELIEKNQIKINKLVGIRGVISSKEIENNYKIFKNLYKKSSINY